MAWTAPVTWVAGQVLTAANLNQQLRDNLNAAFPVGSIHYFMQAGTSVETTVNGFALEMNGVAVSRTTYTNLNSLLSGLSYPFGSGDGSTTFTLPDARGRALYHAAAGGNADVSTLANSDGLALASRSPKHNTTVGSHSHGAGTLGVSNVATSDTTVNVVGSGQQSVLQTLTLTSPSVTGSTGSATPSGGPGGTRPTDLSPWLIAGIFAVKY